MPEKMIPSRRKVEYNKTKRVFGQFFCKEIPSVKTIGLIGGMTWESSLEYYRIINETVWQKLGGFHSAQSIMYSVDFEPLEKWQHQGKWEYAAKLLADAARKLEKGGADFLVICANTMHKLVPEVERHIKIPILHIADVTAQTIKKQKLRKVGLLGTRFTMEEGFYKDRLVQKHGLEVRQKEYRIPLFDTTKIHAQAAVEYALDENP